MSRKDLAMYCYHKDLELVTNGQEYTCLKQRIPLFEVMWNMCVIDLSNCVNTTEYAITGLKSHN